MEVLQRARICGVCLKLINIIILAIFIIIKIKAYKKRKKNNVCLSYLSLLPSKSNDSCGCRCSSGFISSPVNLAPTLLGLWTVHTKYTEVISPLGKEQLQLEICVSRKPTELKEISKRVFTSGSGIQTWSMDEVNLDKFLNLSPRYIARNYHSKHWNSSTDK